MKTLIKSLLAFLSVNCALACSQFDSEIGIRNLGFEQLLLDTTTVE